MSRETYKLRQESRPTRDRNRVISHMQLELANLLYQRRTSLGWSVEELAERSGVDGSRIEMIEEGDTTSIAEVASLCAALSVHLAISHRFEVGIRPAAASRVQWRTFGPSTPETATDLGGLTLERSNWAKPPSTKIAGELVVSGSNAG